MTKNKFVLNGSTYDVKNVINGKGRGIHELVNKDKIIVNEDTIVTDKTDSVIVYPMGETFIVLIKSLEEIKEKQNVIIMSKYVLKKLTEAPTLVSSSVYNNEVNREYNRPRTFNNNRY